jgi:squalene-hopene/tetraprenyl-beta-curcumene cyclase
MLQINRRTFLLAALAAGCLRRPSSDGPLERAARYLWTQQDPDGGFHSSTYGLLRSGQSLTPLILGALLKVPDTVSAHSSSIDSALEFIKRNTDAQGALGRTDESSADYPNYATSLAVSAIINTRRGGFDALAQSMIGQLRAQQFSEDNGWKRGDAAYGGWGMGGTIRRPPDAGHVDLSMTRCVMEALRESGVLPSDPTMARALVFLERCQNPDGGFYFSPVNPEINKAGEAAERFNSYGTATADGVLALRAAGVPETDDRMVKALNWLTSHHLPDRAPGFESPAQASRKAWSTGLRFYYGYVISRAAPHLPLEIPEQAADGSFRNANNLVKEDDPLIATAFAIYMISRGRDTRA